MEVTELVEVVEVGAPTVPSLATLKQIGQKILSRQKLGLQTDQLTNRSSNRLTGAKQYAPFFSKGVIKISKNYITSLPQSMHQMCKLNVHIHV